MKIKDSSVTLSDDILFTTKGGNDSIRDQIPVERAEFSLLALLIGLLIGIATTIIADGISDAIKVGLDAKNIAEGLDPQKKLQASELASKVNRLKRQESRTQDPAAKKALRLKAAGYIEQLAGIIDDQESVIGQNAGPSVAESSQKLVRYMYQNAGRLRRNEISIPNVDLRIADKSNSELLEVAVNEDIFNSIASTIDSLDPIVIDSEVAKALKNPSLGINPETIEFILAAGSSVIDFLDNDNAVQYLAAVASEDLQIEHNISAQFEL